VKEGRERGRRVQKVEGGESERVELEKERNTSQRPNEVVQSCAQTPELYHKAIKFALVHCYAYLLLQIGSIPGLLLSLYGHLLGLVLHFLCLLDLQRWVGASP